MVELSGLTISDLSKAPPAPLKQPPPPEAESSGPSPEQYIDAFVSGIKAPTIYTKPRLKNVSGELCPEHVAFFGDRGEGGPL